MENREIVPVDTSSELVAIPIEEYNRLKSIEREYLDLLQKNVRESRLQMEMAHQQARLDMIIGSIKSPTDDMILRMI